jgi:hypothetical protein
MPAISLLSSAMYPCHSLLVVYLSFQQRSTDFLNFTASTMLCVANTALHGCTLNQVLEKMTSYFLQELTEWGVDMSSIWNPNATQPAHSMFGGDFLNRCFFAAPPAVINRQSHYKFSDKANQLLTYAYCILRALIITYPEQLQQRLKCQQNVATE